MKLFPKNNLTIYAETKIVVNIKGLKEKQKLLSCEFINLTNSKSLSSQTNAHHFHKHRTYRLLSLWIRHASSSILLPPCLPTEPTPQTFESSISPNHQCETTHQETHIHLRFSRRLRSQTRNGSEETRRDHRNGTRLRLRERRRRLLRDTALRREWDQLDWSIRCFQVSDSIRWPDPWV